mgnify:FL=1|jgi:hypothetical protein
MVDNQKTVLKVLRETSRMKTREERITNLRAHGSNLLKDIIRMNYDDAVVCILPEGVPENATLDKKATGKLTDHYDNFRYFFKTQWSTHIKNFDRQNRFLQLVQDISADEAEMLCKAKDKKLKYVGITKKLCQEAFPNLIAK